MFHYLYLNFLDSIPLLNLFQYITLRSILAGILSFLFVVLFGKKFINFLTKKNSVENINKYLNDNHKKKTGTPNMGGFLIGVSILISTLLFSDLSNPKIQILIWTYILFAITGFIDDFTKLRKGTGLKIQLKFFIQIVLTFLISFLIIDQSQTFIYQEETKNINNIILPFTKNIFDLGVIYFVLMMFIILGSANSVNFTDGLDGLATGSLIISFSAITIFTYIAGNSVYSSYLYLPFISNVGEIVVFISALIGSLLGFLWYNSNPAQIFMGDTGSIPMGATLGLVAILIKQEFLLLIIGGIFVIEALSVITQIFSFRIFKKRIFLIAPIHHHFEKLGIKESKIVIRFWIIGIIFSLIAIATLKIR